MGGLIHLEILSGLRGFAHLFLRVLTGTFLVYGVWDNVVSAERMDEFEVFMSQFGFPAVELMAPLSVYTQLLAGVGLVLGLFTRWAGLLVLANFIVAMLMVHLHDDFRTMWPALVLVAIGFLFATTGGGRYSVDRLIGVKA